MPSPTQAPTTTPTITPSPDADPWQETYTDPERICPQQTRELGSPDIAP